MNNKKIIDDVLAHYDRDISHEERTAVMAALNAGENFGYGNMIAWLATAWAISHRADGCDVVAEDYSERGYSFPKDKYPVAKK